jgi:hypothetical protein
MPIDRPTLAGRAMRVERGTVSGAAPQEPATLFACGGSGRLRWLRSLLDAHPWTRTVSRP